MNTTILLCKCAKYEEVGAELFQIDHNALEKVNKLKRIDQIVQIEVAANHMLALRRVQIPSIAEWNHLYLSKWIAEIGFPDLRNVVKYNKITGQDLIDADEDFYYDTLGCSKPNHIIKIKTEVNKAKNPQITVCELYGWGSNNFGQLAMFEKKVDAPKKIDLPFEFNTAGQGHEDFTYISKIYAGFKHSGMLTNHGQVWICGNYKADQ